jgi:hypothetical protein
MQSTTWSYFEIVARDESVAVGFDFRQFPAGLEAGINSYCSFLAENAS